MTSINFFLGFKVLFLLCSLASCFGPPQPRGICSDNQFRCNITGKCVEKKWLCDGKDDCGDKSDEAPSLCGDKKCPDNEWQCSVTKKCVPRTWLCDGEDDCGDNSDEAATLCSDQKCPDNKWQCTVTKKCVLKSWLCDGEDDCGDNSDETATLCSKGDFCSDDKFKCTASKKCVPRQWVCDGENDCDDKSDEAPDLCAAGDKKCPDNLWRCAVTQNCVPRRWLCDEQDDCGDNSDEAAALCNPTAGPSNQTSEQPDIKNSTIIRACDPNVKEPQFERSDVKVQVLENREVNTSIEFFKACDPSGGNSSKAVLSIDKSSDPEGYFDIDEEGFVILKRPLDRETKDQFQVRILATDSGTPPKTATANLTVVVKDVNDNAPKFSEPYRVVLPAHVSPNTKIAEIRATDLDDKGNGPPFHFDLHSADDVIRSTFQVARELDGVDDDGTGVVILLRSLDHDQRKEYLIPITIDDSGDPVMTGTSTLTVISAGPVSQETNAKHCDNSTESSGCSSAVRGPKQEQAGRSFHSNGWARFEPLDMHTNNSHLSLEFITRESDGQLLYNGPVVPYGSDNNPVSDFISLELKNGYPRLLLNFGSGAVELKVNNSKTLNDGEWHRLDVLWDTKTVRLVVDYCKSGIFSEPEGGSVPKFDDSSCQAQSVMPAFNKHLDVHASLQLGGLNVSDINPAQNPWWYAPRGKSFDGCIKNVIFNSNRLNLLNPGLSQNSTTGCARTEEVCARTGINCGEHGVCAGNLTETQCECLPGFTGPACNSTTAPATFKKNSYVQYSLSFEPHPFRTEIQLRFKAREINGELFRVSDTHGRQYAVLEIKNNRLRFCYNLNRLRQEEKDLWISTIAVNDGKWHTAKVIRYGSASMLTLDEGEGDRYNETFVFEGHQQLAVDRRAGVYAGGKPEFIGPRVFEVLNGFKKGCLDDIRLNGVPLPLPPTVNNQWGEVTRASNVRSHCTSDQPSTTIFI